MEAVVWPALDMLAGRVARLDGIATGLRDMGPTPRPHRRTYGPKSAGGKTIFRRGRDGRHGYVTAEAAKAPGAFEYLGGTYSAISQSVASRSLCEQSHGTSVPCAVHMSTCG